MAIPKLLKETREKLKLQNISLGYDADADIAALDIDSHIFLGHEGSQNLTSLELKHEDENAGRHFITVGDSTTSLTGYYNSNSYGLYSDDTMVNIYANARSSPTGDTYGAINMVVDPNDSYLTLNHGGGYIALTSNDSFGDEENLPGAGVVLNDVFIASCQPHEENTLDFNSAVLSNISNPLDDEDAATKGYVDSALESAGGTFYAIYQQTTYQEVLDAYKAGKSIVCVVDGVMFYMYDAPVENSTTDTIYFYSPYSYNQMGERVRYVYLAASNTWNGIYVSTLNSFASSKYYNGETLISSSTGYYRPIRVSMSAPTASDGNIGDIWVVYSNS